MKKKLHLSSMVMLFALFMILPIFSNDFFAVKDKVIDESRFKLGFLYFTPLILMDNVGYTSNIFNYQAKEYPDWTGDLGLGLRASAIAANRVILQAEDLPSYSFYLENKNLRSWSNRFSSTLYSYVGPFNIKAGYVQKNLSQRPNLEFGRPYRYTSSEWSGEADIGRSSRLFLTAYVALRKLAYDEEKYLGGYNLALSLDHRQNTYGLRLNHRIFTSTLIYLDYSMSDFVFGSSSVRDARGQTMGLGVVFPEIGALQGRLQIGYHRLSPKNPLFQSTHSLNGQGEIHFTLMERLRLSGSYSLGTTFSYTASDLFYDHETFGGGVEVYLTRFLKGGASYQDGRMRYRSFLDLELRRSDRIRNQRYYLAIPFLGGTSLGFAYNVYRLTSDALDLDYTRNFWGGFISYEF
jgi:hypothetical protein